jgi:predicted acylesterase/phospholipase RssA
VTAGADLRLGDYTKPTRSCDVVMKGGISSGVVYPHAVCELAQTYRFRNVGGTSAGAIAAAATAAAEYGRRRGGFNKLAVLPAWLGADGNLPKLFQPARSTKRLFAVLMAKLEGGWWRATGTALVWHLPEALIGAAIGLALLVLAALRIASDQADALAIVAAAVGLLAALVGAAVGVLASMAVQAIRAIPDNGYGLCPGGPGAQAGGAPALTPWLSELLNDTAGLPMTEPLTFGHLWAGPEAECSQRSQEPPAEDRQLQLAMMTTNLTNRCGHQVPWRNREWFFDPIEFRRLFPAKVVDWMEAHPPSSEGRTRSARQRSRMRLALMRPLLPMPDPADLPVVVATRMSLSFPILLSAVPLWQIDMTREENAVLDDWRDWACEQGECWDPLADDPSEWPSDGQPGSRPFAERAWFSDGGISSNFPVHFFDRLVPRWPTFAINLRPFAVGQEHDEVDQSNNTWMVDTNKEGIRRWWYRLPDRPALGFKDQRLFGFLSNIVRTMQNRVDEEQMRVPGYRDRIAHVSLSKSEGGMNLTMPPEDIAALTARGREAAKRLRRAYGPPDPPGKAITWDNHRWVRLRSSLAVLEEMHGHFADGYLGPPEPGETTYSALLNRGPKDLPDSYRWKPTWAQRSLAKEEIDAILAAAQAVERSSESVGEGAPNPRPQGRIAPAD